MNLYVFHYEGVGYETWRWWVAVGGERMERALPRVVLRS